MTIFFHKKISCGFNHSKLLQYDSIMILDFLYINKKILFQDQFLRFVSEQFTFTRTFSFCKKDYVVAKSALFHYTF